MQHEVRFVLVETSHPGNIGAAARAMKNMQYDQLYLVNPKFFPHAEATARASGADDVLAQARVCESLEQALRDCNLIFGASARLRTISWPLEDPRQCAGTIAASKTGTLSAIVFGRERVGLTNRELDLCHKMLHIPSNPDYSSLNLAAAVQVVAYELQMSTRSSPTQAIGCEPTERASTLEEMALFYEHLERVITATKFLDPTNPRQLPRRLRRYFNRSEPSNVELNILRGILTSIEQQLSR